MDMLTAALGVEKPSIYSNFGSKKGLYLEALESYHVMLRSRIASGLQSDVSARDGLDRVMNELMAPSNAAIRRGCLATNSALEIADLDPEIRSRIKETFDDLLGLFTQAIRRGQQDGSIRDDRPAGALAQFLLSCFGGVRVLEKTGVDAPHWSEAARLALSVLDAPAAPRSGKSGPASKAKAAPRRKPKALRA